MICAFDIVIAGGGIAGASLGSELAGKLSVAIVEAESVCGYHSTGRSAAFWLESYGGDEVALLSGASRAFLAEPPLSFSERGFLQERGAVHISRGATVELPAKVERRVLGRSELEVLLPGLRSDWRVGASEPGCADIDVAALHSAYLRQFKRSGGILMTGAGVRAAVRRREGWLIHLDGGAELEAGILVNAAGAWADPLARAAGVEPIGIAPKRRTMVQLRVGRTGLRSLPLVISAAGDVYFKGEGDSSIWLSPHDEIDSEPCDTAPEELDVATAIDRFQRVVDWPVERVERSWAGLRSFAPDRLPVYGFDVGEPRFFWCAGQGGFGIQTAPAAARLAAGLLLGSEPQEMVRHIDPAIFSPARFERVEP